MANRSYRPEDLVELPVRDPDDALALASQLAAAAAHEEKPAHGKGHPLAAPLAHALADVQAARAELEEASKPVPARPRNVKTADRVEDNAVGALSDWFKAFLRLPEETPARKEAAVLHAAFFG